MREREKPIRWLLEVYIESKMKAFGMSYDGGGRLNHRENQDRGGRPQI